MKVKQLMILALLGLAWNVLPAQGDATIEPAASPKGSMALSIQLGRASTQSLRSYGTPAFGSTSTMSLGLQWIRPNDTRHILSLDMYRRGSPIRSTTGTVLGYEPGTYVGYEFRRYRQIGNLPVKWYHGAWVQASGAAAFGTNTPFMAVARVNTGISGGLQYDISKRFFIEGGVRVGLLSTEFQRDEAGRNSVGVGTGRHMFESRLGLGIRL